MTKTRRDEVPDKHGVVKDTLRRENQEPHQSAGTVQLGEGDEVHSLVVGFFQEGFNPALVELEAADGVQVTEAAGYCAGDAGDGFEEDEADELGGSRLMMGTMA